MNDRTKKILFGRPKKKSDDHSLTRRELISLMFKVAFLEAMALSLILPSVISTGEILPAVTLKQSGSNLCTIGIAQQTCSKVINFSPAFTSTPTGSAWSTNQIAGLDKFTGVAYFITDSTTWLNMPIAKTEFLGNTNHRLNFTQGMGGWFHVKVLVPSNNASAILLIEFSLNAGSTWNAFQNIGIASAGDLTCFCGSPDFVQSATPVLWRITGQNGGGTGDNPVFQYIYEEMLGAFNGVEITTLAITKTFIAVAVNIPFITLTALTVNFDWQAEVA